MNTAELSAWLRLCHTDHVGPQCARQLLSCFGSAPTVFGQSEAALRQVVTQRQANALLQTPPDLPALLARTLHWLDRSPMHRIWCLGDAAYPTALLDLSDPPLMLYGQGSLPTRAGLAVVGSRNPTHQGEQIAQQMSQALAQAGLCIVSGLALGVDGAAHVGALGASGASAAPGDACLTVAVVGTGLDRVYPRQHQALAQRIAQQGLLLSEYPLGTPPLAAHFPRRNRLIAALGLGTLVVEAALHSGSLITAQLALDMGREVMAVPGSIHAPQSHGCHALIRQGAKLVESVHDVLEELHLPTAPHLTASTTRIDVAHSLLSHMGHDPVTLDALLARTEWDLPTLQTELLTLELSGQIGRLPGGLFQRSG